MTIEPSGLANSDEGKPERRLVSPWLQVPGASHCAMRILAGGDPSAVADRVAFIEKTARVRIGPLSARDTDSRNWREGPKGDDGRDPESRAWCDGELRRLGYQLPDDQSHDSKSLD